MTADLLAGELGPLSFQQEEMVRRLRTFPECAPRYDLVRIFDLLGPMDVECLIGAVADVVERHPTLRTTIAQVDGNYCQHVHPSMRLDVARRQSAPGNDLAPDLLRRRHGTKEVLAGCPLFRAEVIEHEREHCSLAITIHHLLCDSLSLIVLCRDLSECYTARMEQRPACLPDLPITYLEYARRERANWPACAEHALPFWRTMTAGAPRSLAWRQPRSTAPFATAEVSFQLSPKLTEAVRRTAANARVTPFLVILAATGAALGSVAGYDDLLVGTDFANREEEFKQNLIGHLLNTRMTRFRLGRQSFRELVLTVREMWLEADTYRDAYLDLVLQDIGVAWLTSVLFDPGDFLVHPDFPQVTSTSMPVEPMDPYWRELLVIWSWDDSGWVGQILYRPSCVDAATVEAIPEEIRRILHEGAE